MLDGHDFIGESHATKSESVGHTEYALY